MHGGSSRAPDDDVKRKCRWGKTVESERERERERGRVILWEHRGDRARDGKSIVNPPRVLSNKVTGSLALELVGSPLVISASLVPPLARVNHNAKTSSQMREIPRDDFAGDIMQ